MPHFINTYTNETALSFSVEGYSIASSSVQERALEGIEVVFWLTSDDQINIRVEADEDYLEDFNVSKWTSDWKKRLLNGESLNDWVLNK